MVEGWSVVKGCGGGGMWWCKAVVVQGCGGAGLWWCWAEVVRGGGRLEDACEWLSLEAARHRRETREGEERMAPRREPGRVREGAERHAAHARGRLLRGDARRGCDALKHSDDDREIAACWRSLLTLTLRRARRVGSFALGARNKPI